MAATPATKIAPASTPAAQTAAPALPEPLSIPMYRASDGTMYQRKSDAAVREIHLALKAAYIGLRPGQTGMAEQFAAAAIDGADVLIPLLQQVAAAKALT